MKICNECGEHTEGMDRNNRGLYCTVCCANLAGAQDAPKPKRKRARKKQAPVEEEKQAPVEEEKQAPVEEEKQAPVEEE